LFKIAFLVFWQQLIKEKTCLFLKNGMSIWWKMH